MLYSVGLVSAVQQLESVIIIYIPFLLSLSPPSHPTLELIFKIGVWLLYNIVLVSAV